MLLWFKTKDLVFLFRLDDSSLFDVNLPLSQCVFAMQRSASYRTQRRSLHIPRTSESSG